MLRAITAFTVVALLGCWFWWLEEEKWCRAVQEKAWPPDIFFCLPLSPFVAFGIVFICGGAFIWMRLRGHQN